MGPAQATGLPHISDLRESRGASRAYNESWRRFAMRTRFYALVLIGMTAMAADTAAVITGSAHCGG